jgi:hypothetical protein
MRRAVSIVLAALLFFRMFRLFAANSGVLPVILRDILSGIPAPQNNKVYRKRRTKDRRSGL